MLNLWILIIITRGLFIEVKFCQTIGWERISDHKIIVACGVSLTVITCSLTVDVFSHIFSRQ